MKREEYEILVPVKETWVFRVRAFSKKEALEKYNNDDDGVEQICSIGGWPKDKRGYQSASILVRGKNENR